MIGPYVLSAPRSPHLYNMLPEIGLMCKMHPKNDLVYKIHPKIDHVYNLHPKYSK